MQGVCFIYDDDKSPQKSNPPQNPKKFPKSPNPKKIPHLIHTYNRTHPQILSKFSKLLSKISPLTANFPKSFPKFHKNINAPPPACIFSDLRHFFCFILGVSLKKFANFFRKRHFLCYNFILSLGSLGKRMVNLERNLL